MAVECPKFSYTKPRRLPKKRSRPSNAAFRAAVVKLDLINRNAGGYRVPAMVELLSDEEISPETEYRMLNQAVHKALGRQVDLANAEQVNRNKTSKKSTGISKRQRQQPIIIHSDDEIDSSSATSSSSCERKSQRKQPCSRPTRIIKRRRESFLSSSDSTDDKTTRKSKRPRQDLAAELHNLDIDMEGWSTTEGAPRRLRQRK